MNKQTSLASNGLQVDDQGLEKAWRRLRNELNRNGKPETNEELKEMAANIIASYIINRSF